MHKYTQTYMHIHTYTHAPIHAYMPVHTSEGTGRPAKRVRISNLNLCQIEASFLKSHHKVKNNSSSISKRCTSNDRQRPAITRIFLVSALASNKFVCLASKQGYSWVRPTLRDLSIRLNLCVAACCSVSRRY